MRYITAGLTAFLLLGGAAFANDDIEIFHRGGELNSQALGIDSSGNVFGLREATDETGRSQEAYWRSANGIEKKIPALPGYNYSQPYAISANSGLVVGVAGRPAGHANGSLQAFAWNPATGAIEGLGFVGEDVSSFAWSVSADGNTVVGYSNGGTKGTRPCVWTRSDSGWKATELSAPLDDNPLLATTGLRVSPDGKKIVGSLTFQVVVRGRIYISHLYTWEKADDGSWNRKEISEHGIAAAVNDSGTVVGHFLAESGEERAFVYSKSGGFAEIGVLPGSKGSRATGVNNAGTVVGQSGESGYELAFVWKEGKLEKLTLPSDIILSAALGINKSGQIVGYLGGEQDAQISSFVAK